MDKNYWVVRLGKGNEYADVCRKSGIIAVGWSELDLDLSQYAELDQRAFVDAVGPKLAVVIPDRTQKSISGAARQLYKFAVLMKPGDVVMSPANSEGLKFFGIVRSGYRYEPADSELTYRHRRDIEWIAEIDKSAFSEKLRNSSSAIMTVFNISNHVDEIETLLRGKQSVVGISDDKVVDLKEFGMESQLEEFIVENWDRLSEFKNYEIYKEDEVEIGKQYATQIGRIDILARSKDGKEWLVIELKKGKTGDDVIGQTLRYIGWIKKNEAESNETVRGLIIGGQEDEKLMYALETLENVGFMTYSVQFKLQKVK